MKFVFYVLGLLFIFKFFFIKKLECVILKFFMIREKIILLWVLRNSSKYIYEFNYMIIN